MSSRLLVPLFVCLALILPAGVVPAQDRAFAPEPIVGSGGGGGSTGFVWLERENSTHVRVTHVMGVGTVDLAGIETPQVDLEILGLPQSRPVLLRNEYESWPDLTDQAGVLIAWNVQTISQTLEVLDLETGSLYLILSIRWGGDSMCYYCPDPPPKPPVSKDDIGRTTIQAAYSYTPYARVTTANCFEHSVTVGVHVSGGKAALAGTAGSSYTYKTESCLTITSQGSPTRLRKIDFYRQDTYDDKSTKVYLRSPGEGLLYESFSAGYSPRGSELQTATTSPLVMERTETNAGSVHLAWTSGGAAWGVGLGVTMGSTGKHDSRVRVEIQSPNATLHNYSVNFVNGDGDRGILGEVWFLGFDRSGTL